MFQPLQDTLGAFLSYIPQLIGAVVILILGYIIAKVLQAIVGRVLQAVGFDEEAVILRLKLLHTLDVRVAVALPVYKGLGYGRGF